MSEAYRNAGVNVDAANELVERIKPTLARQRKPEILSSLGGFAALAKVPKKFNNPVIVLGTDGVGTKLDLLIQHNRLDTVGQDLVAMCVNDTLVYGAEPSLFLDYYATGKLRIEEAAVVIASIANACDLAGCALVGGETAEHPGFHGDGQFDLAGFCVGWVEEEEILKPENVQAGDRIIGVASSGPHSNGYSLIRKVLAECSRPPSEEILLALLEPTRIYAKLIIPSIDRVQAIAHITGGGFRDNLPRAFSDTLEAHIAVDSWTPQPVFNWLQEQASMSKLDMLSTFNCGLGLILFVDPTIEDKLRQQLNDAGESTFSIGTVQPKQSPCPAGTLVVSDERFELT